MNGTFITAGNDRCIHVWSGTTFAQLARLEGHKEAVTCLTLDGNFLLSGSEDGVVHMWDLHSYMSLASLQIHDAPIEDMLVVAENGLLVTCSADCTVRVWDYGVGDEVQVWRHPEQFRCLTMRRSTGHVLAGTEQHNIVAFPFAEAIAARERQREERQKQAEEEAAQLARQEAAADAPADLVAIGAGAGVVAPVANAR